MFGHAFDYRYFALRVAAAFAFTLISVGAFASCTQPQNAIEAENCLAGTDSSQWSLGGSAPDPTLEGFTTDISYNVGQTVSFKISTSASSYHIEIYRMGFYQGNGARLISTFTPTASLAQNQPACLTDSTTGLADCGNWRVSATWAIPSTAVSGIYFAHLVRNDTGGDSEVTFVVRNEASHSAILFQTADETWQAYNSYGGHSLYGGLSGSDLTNRAYKVSYNRPLVQIEVNSQVFYAEYPMVRFLESNGYDVSYFSAVDAARLGSLMLNHRVYMTVGHDEYVSGPRRINMEAARDAGVNMAIFSGNDMFWKTRFENSTDGSNTPYRTLVCYKETLGPKSNPVATAAVDPQDPPTWTGTWRDPAKSPPADGGRPENAFSGQLFRVNGPGSDNDSLSIKVPAADGKMRFWRNTAIAAQTAGQTYTLPANTLGYEWDTEEDNGSRPAGLIDLSTATYTLTSDYLLDYGGLYGSGTATHHLSLYRAPSGALVFGAGTVQWSWGLDANHDGDPTSTDVNMKQATINLFADMGVQPATLQAGLVPASQSTDTTPPASTITSPAAGATVQPFTAVTVQGTATDVGGVVGGVEFSGDGGKTWHPAIGRQNWSYSWNVAGSGQVQLLSRAVDDSGNIQSTPSSSTVNVATLPFDTIFVSGQVPATADGGPDGAVELGVRFKSDVNGTILGIRFYKSAANTGTHVGNLWSNTGTLLATATFTNETGSGWQQVNFSKGVPITAGTVYVASYHTTVGHYAADKNFFAASGADNSPLHALQDGSSAGPDGVFGYGAAGTFPNSGSFSSNYWVDVAFAPSPTGTLTSIEVAPKNPTITAGTLQQFTATGTYTDNSTQDITAQVTWSSSNANVATIDAGGDATGISGGTSTITASLGSASNSTVLTVLPGPLAIATTSLSAGIVGSPYAGTLVATGGSAPYVWALNGGTLPGGITLSSTGVLQGTPTAVGTYTFSVKLTDSSSPQQSVTAQLSLTILPASTERFIWSPATVPATADGGPDGPVELGVRFKADVDGSLVGIRFYKSAANTGTHVANLWTGNGALLATATFANETASGWQQVNFPTPVAITANAVYVASYHSTVGHYSADANYFTNSGVDSAPLHALQDGVNGSNGGYSYGSASSFPGSDFKSANYWVDVAFIPAPTITSIAISPSNPTVTAGATQQFSALARLSDGTTQDVTTSGSWSSSNSQIATVNASGLATTLSGGSSTISFTRGTISGSTTLTVQPTTLLITSTSVPAGIAGTPYSATLSAKGGSFPFTWGISGGSLPAGLSLSSGGQITGTPTLVGTYNFSVQITDAGSPQQSAFAQLSLTILPTSTPRSIWSSSALPGNVDSGPDDAVELGVRFKSDVNGSISGIRFYKASTNTGTHIANLWTSTGTLLATATFANETASGWQQVNFSTPVSVTANTIYVASYHTNVGHYSDDQSYFNAAGVDNAPLHALQDGVSGANGVYAYGSSSFPSSGFRSSNYWVDVVLVPSVTVSSIAVTPANSSVVAGQAQQFTATATYGDGSTGDVTHLVTWSSSNKAVASINSSGLATTIAGGSTTIQAAQGNVSGTTQLTVQPTTLVVATTSLPNGVAGLSYSATLSATGGTAPYSWSITSGILPAGLTLTPATGQISGTPTASGTASITVKVADGGVPQQSATAQLTILIPSTFSIWSTSSTPALIDAGGDSPVELGVRFTSDVNGSITGLRFYKAASNTGTHVADLWTSTGTLLATATFTNETASGWQQANFGTPVPITANTVYVASYHTDVGHYSDDLNFFATAGTDNPPLHALQDGVNGSNGVFGYGGVGTFPNSSFRSSNYWVDVVLGN